MSHRTERSQEARQRILEHTYEIMRDALQVVHANGDMYSSHTARKALNRVDTQMRRSNV
jgi:hypothetical protein